MRSLRPVHLLRAALPAALAILSTAGAAAPTADEIVAQYISARGGLEKIKAIHTLRQSGRASAGANRQSLITRELKRPNRARLEFTAQGITSVFVTDGQRGWEITPLEKNHGPRPLPEEVVKETAEQADIEGPLVDYKSKGHKVELAGRETVNGREAYRLKLTLKSGDVRTEYIDVKNHQLVRSDSTRQLRGLPVQLQTSFFDQKKTGGVLFPGRVEVSSDARPEKLVVIVDRVEINPQIPDDRFTLAGATAP